MTRILLSYMGYARSRSGELAHVYVPTEKDWRKSGAPKRERSSAIGYAHALPGSFEIGEVISFQAREDGKIIETSAIWHDRLDDPLIEEWERLSSEAQRLDKPQPSEQDRAIDLLREFYFSLPKGARKAWLQATTRDISKP